MKSFLKDSLIIAIGCAVTAVGLNLFLLPQKLSPGGVSTLGTVLFYTLGIPLSLTTLVINSLLFVLGYRFLGKRAVIRTVIGIVMLSLFLEICPTYDLMQSDLVAGSVSGGVLIGIGVGLVIRAGGSTGGSDFAAVMLGKRFSKLSVPALILAIDFVIIMLSGIVFSSLLITFYSTLAMYGSYRTLEMLLGS